MFELILRAFSGKRELRTTTISKLSVVSLKATFGKLVNIAQQPLLTGLRQLEPYKTHVRTSGLWSDL